MKLFDAPLRGPQDSYYTAIRSRSDRDHYRIYLEKMWARFEPYADRDFPISIQSAFVPRYWEMYLGCSLLLCGKRLVPRHERQRVAGPDLLAIEHDRLIAVEAVVPHGGNGADGLAEPPRGEVFTVPDEAITLRYLSVIEDKRRQYLGWLERDQVASADAFVIAVNSGRLPYGSTDVFPPRVCKALFGLGAEYVTIQRGTIVGGGFHLRPSVPKSSGTEISARLFTDSQSALISAVLYSDETIDRRYDPRIHYDVDRLGNNLVLIHNPMASVPIPRGWLGVGLEFYGENGELHHISYPDSDVDCEG